MDVGLSETCATPHPLSPLCGEILTSHAKEIPLKLSIQGDKLYGEQRFVVHAQMEKCMYFQTTSNSENLGFGHSTEPYRQCAPHADKNSIMGTREDVKCFLCSLSKLLEHQSTQRQWH